MNSILSAERLTDQSQVYLNFTLPTGSLLRYFLFAYPTAIPRLPSASTLFPQLLRDPSPLPEDAFDYLESAPKQGKAVQILMEALVDKSTGHLVDVSPPDDRTSVYLVYFVNDPTNNDAVHHSVSRLWPPIGEQAQAKPQWEKHVCDSYDRAMLEQQGEDDY